MEERKVKTLRYNWRQVGSTIDRDGAGDDYEFVTIGKNYVTEIIEHEPHNGNEVWNYEVILVDGTSYRIFNPNFVEYLPIMIP
jgi:hypothetical protein